MIIITIGRSATAATGISSQSLESMHLDRRPSRMFHWPTHGAIEALWRLHRVGGFCACRMLCLVIANFLLLVAGLGCTWQSLWHLEACIVPAFCRHSLDRCSCREGLISNMCIYIYMYVCMYVCIMYVEYCTICVYICILKYMYTIDLRELES